MVKHVFPCACCRTCYSFSLLPWFQLIWTGLVLPKWAAFSIEWFPCPFFKITREILCFSADQKGNISLAAKRHSQLVLLVFFATDCRNMSKSENCCHFRWNVELYYVVFSSFSLPLSLLFPWRFFCSFSMCAPFRSLPFLQFHLLISFLFFLQSSFHSLRHSMLYGFHATMWKCHRKKYTFPQTKRASKVEPRKDILS